MVVSSPGYITDTTAIESSELIVGINQFNIELESQSSYQLELNIQTPSNDVEEVNVYYQDSFTHGILSNMATLLPKDNYQIRLDAEGLSPVIFNTYLNDNRTFDIQLNEENILFSDEFSELTNWEISSGSWEILDGKLISQSELFYDNNINQRMISNTIPVEESSEYVVKVDLRYELEWENDFFNMMYVSANDTVELLNLTGDKYDFYTEYIPLSIHEGQQNGQILLTLETDHNLDYRGVEINKLTLYQSGEYTSNLSNSIHMLPDNFTLEQNYPNPFNPTTQINFHVPHLSSVSISIYNIRGELIEELVDNIYKPGHYTVYLDAREYASGIYLYRMEAENSIYARKFIIIK